MASCSSLSGVGRCSSRAASSRPFIGHSSEDVPAHGLASEADVLRVIAYLREQNSQNMTVSSMSCDLDHNYATKCESEGGCLGRGEPCLALKEKIKWLQAGIVTVADKRIRKKIEELQLSYNKVFKNRNRETPAAKAEREVFVRAIEQTFDIKDANARQLIQMDPHRTKEAVAEDLAFYDDYLGNICTCTYNCILICTINCT